MENCTWRKFFDAVRPQIVAGVAERGVNPIFRQNISGDFIWKCSEFPVTRCGSQTLAPTLHQSENRRY
jgi:hypothetical protein